MTIGNTAMDRSTMAPEALRQLVEAELSMTARVGHVVLLLVSLLMTVGIVSLWATEPFLPLRTQVAFGVMTVIGVSWSLFATRVLTGRRVLYARHRIVAGRLAVTFTSVFALGAGAIAYLSGSPAAYLSVALGGAMVAVAIWLLVRAHRAMARLDARRQVLERETRRTA
jgi:hypothetical protein